MCQYSLPLYLLYPTRELKEWGILAFGGLGQVSLGLSFLTCKLEAWTVISMVVSIS